MKIASETEPTILLQLLQEQQLMNQKLLQQNEQLQARIEQLQHQLEKLFYLLYGTKSEKQPISEAKTTKKSDERPVFRQKDRSGPTPNGRGRLPEALPRVSIEHDIEEKKRYCQACGLRWHRLGQVVTEQLDFKPAEFFVKEHVRYKYACRGCESVFIADCPVQPIDKGLAGAGVLAEVVINKYQDALPLYRQQQRFARLGITVPRSTLCDWVTQVVERLQPIVDKMKSDVLIPGKRIFTDDTPIRVLDNDKKGKTHLGRLWTYVGGGERKPLCVLYDYTPSRSQKGPQQYLEGFTGYCQADAYPGYDQLYQSGKVIEVGCWAHARRAFVEIMKTTKQEGLANEAVHWIGQLYGIEETGKAFTCVERFYYRRRQARPILKQFKRWLLRHHLTVLPKSPIGKAIAYVLNHWQALNNYLRDGMLEIDNNTAERAIKPLVIGRKNYLFAGSHEGAKRAAVLYSILETCKLNGVNTWDYLNDVLTRLPTTLMKDLGSLLPYNWTKLTTNCQ